MNFRSFDIALPGRLAAGVAAATLAATFALPAAAQSQRTFATALNGAKEAPSNTSPGGAAAIVTLGFNAASVLTSMRVQVTFADLVAGVTAAHIHCCTATPGTGTAGVATVTPTFTNFPSGVTFGSYDFTYDMTLASSYNAAFITANGNTVAGAASALVAGMNSGSTYLNIHTTAFPNGEIRGFLQPVPEPQTYALMLAGLGAVGWVARRRRPAQ